MAEVLAESTVRVLSPEEYTIRLVQFVIEYEFDQIVRLFTGNTFTEPHLRFSVTASDLIHFDASLAFMVLHYPSDLLPIFETAIFRAAELLIAIAVRNESMRSARAKTIYIHITSLPPDLIKVSISQIIDSNYCSLLQISGTVVRTGGVRMLELSRKYQCQNSKCRQIFCVYADPEQSFALLQPTMCPSMLTDSNVKCNSNNIREIESDRVCVDYQEIKLYDKLDQLSVGSIPRSITLILKADLVDKFNPGEDVVVVGTTLLQWQPLSKGLRCRIDVAIQVNSILSASNRDSSITQAVGEETFKQFWKDYRARDAEFEARDCIIGSICPQLYGMYDMKLALLLALIGGTSSGDANEINRRQNIHVLMVGDPGCGQLYI